MNMQETYYKMVEKLRPYAEPHMSEEQKNITNMAIRAGEPYEALADYLTVAGKHLSTPRNLIIDAYNLIDDDYLDSYNALADLWRVPRRKHSPNYIEE